MKNKFLPAVVLTAMLAFTSCSDDSSEDFNNANGNVTKKYVTSVNVVPTDSPMDAQTFTVTYDANGRVTKTSDGEESSFFVYGDNKLSKITGEGEPLDINELYNSPFDAFELGQVLQYDNNGNPVKLRLFQRDDYDNSIIQEYTGEITYDNTPNPFFYTLEAAGLIEVIDNVRLNFSLSPQAEELVKAKLLLPVNNPKKFVIKYADGTVMSQTVADYVYDADKYPVAATFTETGEDGSNITAATYSYK